MESLFDSISQEYKIIVCTTPELIRQAQTIRHKVYCEEKKFEAQNTDFTESDPFDKESIHLIAYDRKTAEPVGTVRVIYSKELPVYDYLYDKKEDFNKLDGIRVELSRLAILPQNRSQSSTRLAVGLFYASSYVAVRSLKCTHVYAFMTRGLNASIKRLGFRPKKLSESIEMNGARNIYEFPPGLHFLPALVNHSESDIDELFYRLADFSCLLEDPMREIA